MNFFFLIIVIISVVFQIYKKYKEAAEENKPQKPQNYGEYTPKPNRPTENRGQDVPQQKPSSIEEALEEMMRQAQQRKQSAERQYDLEPELELDSLGRPIESIERTTSRLDTPKSTSEPGKNYKFSDSLVTSTLTESIRKEQEKGILKKEELGISKREKNNPFGKVSPRDAFKYSILFERKYS